MERVLRILIVKLSAIGDVVHTLPLLEVIKGNWPNARIDWVVEEDASALITDHPLLDRVLISKRKSWQRKIFQDSIGSVAGEVRGFLKELRNVRYDLVLDIQGLFKSGLITALARGKRKLGLSDAREISWLFYSEPSVKVSPDEHAVDRYLKVAGFLGLDALRWEGKIPVNSGAKERVVVLMEKNGLGDKPVVAINPIAKWPTKLWSVEGFSKVADRLRKDFCCDVVFTGSSSDLPVIEEIAAMMKMPSVIFAGETGLKELAFFLSRCSAMVTTDTGPMHIAAAMGCPVVALFGPTAPQRTGPYGDCHTVVTAGVTCSPCFRKRCYHMTCMREIRTDDVIAAVGAILDRKPSVYHKENDG
ncbi:MAG: lipopolysaccharide heptosyltransferase I [Deltaproteobacteria bacterium CG_4_8_14_3_um_filter_51_11]|nr:glycosyltransferase family 9 protein [bacterium]PIP47558.1 MAG: lipopolysaccharide heptosyltransferase I [Deltaproteobacteria bacterium CG23_combo_of_CG06-09_8_20_14_all_51_20]PIX20225.1 MAG: lipopolysaccharide heptosyltransferase I [Deltaproteobacteria bacterium CG_4_8_14_3_um_filter_51_11]PIY25524.1 MAG: lipopolysaccharide heptosyltransferase I [Deltaproteobacteria bacterium CG_4_10_14_3_um_filter_51_14]PJB35405.1 MAG: lipopolysaccharide heptosyltransferase I [Deltaproteobacteria bacterium